LKAGIRIARFTAAAPLRLPGLRSGRGAGPLAGTARGFL
jgi:hypothetical protein